MPVDSCYQQQFQLFRLINFIVGIGFVDYCRMLGDELMGNQHLSRLGCKGIILSFQLIFEIINRILLFNNIEHVLYIIEGIDIFHFKIKEIVR